MFSRRYRKRTLIVMFYAFCGQSTAILVINNYGPTFYKTLGYSTSAQLFFQAFLLFVTETIRFKNSSVVKINKLGNVRKR